MGVNKYGYQLWCDFYWSDTSPEGRFFVVIFLLQGKGNDLHLMSSKTKEYSEHSECHRVSMQNFLPLRMYIFFFNINEWFVFDVNKLPLRRFVVA